MLYSFNCEMLKLKLFIFNQGFLSTTILLPHTGTDLKLYLLTDPTFTYRKQYAAKTGIRRRCGSFLGTSFASDSPSMAWKVNRVFISCLKQWIQWIYVTYNTTLDTIFFSAILVIYLTQWLDFQDDHATGIFHAFSMLCYFMPLFGGIISDSWLGKYRWDSSLTDGIFCHTNLNQSLMLLYDR